MLGLKHGTQKAGTENHGAHAKALIYVWRLASPTAEHGCAQNNELPKRQKCKFGEGVKKTIGQNPKKYSRWHETSRNAQKGAKMDVLPKWKLVKIV